jgi:hypothetical protein
MTALCRCPALLRALAVPVAAAHRQRAGHEAPATTRARQGISAREGGWTPRTRHEHTCHVSRVSRSHFRSLICLTSPSTSRTISSAA